MQKILLASFLVAESMVIEAAWVGLSWIPRVGASDMGIVGYNKAISSNVFDFVLDHWSVVSFWNCGKALFLQMLWVLLLLNKFGYLRSNFFADSDGLLIDIFWVEGRIHDSSDEFCSLIAIKNSWVRWSGRRSFVVLRANLRSNRGGIVCALLWTSELF